MIKKLLLSLQNKTLFYSIVLGSITLVPGCLVQSRHSTRAVSSSEVLLFDIPLPLACKQLSYWSDSSGAQKYGRYSCTYTMTDLYTYLEQGLQSMGWLITGRILDDEQSHIIAEKPQSYCSFTLHKNRKNIELTIALFQKEEGCS